MTTVASALGRPWTAGTAVWTAVATAVCALPGAVFGALGLAVVDEDRSADLVLLLLAPAAVLTLAGARALAARRGRGLLLTGSMAMAVVLAVAGVLDDRVRTDGIGLPAWLSLCLAPPLVAAAFALVPSVGEWLGRSAAPAPPVPRPDEVTTAAVLGVLTGVPAVVLGWLATSLSLDAPSQASPPGPAALLVGIALLVGARRLLDGGTRGVLVCAAAAAVGVVLAAVVPGAPDAGSLFFGLGVLLPLPVATLVATLRRHVSGESPGR